MNSAHWHLLLNHIPTIGVPGGMFLIIMGMIRKENSYVKTGLFSFVFLTIITLATYQTGNLAHEEILINASEETHDFIFYHEKAASLARFAMIILGILSIATACLLSKKYYWIKFALWFILVFSLMVFFLMAKTGSTGGKIMHPEIRNN